MQCSGQNYKEKYKSYDDITDMNPVVREQLSFQGLSFNRTVLGCSDCNKWIPLHDDSAAAMSKLKEIKVKDVIALSSQVHAERMLFFKIETEQKIDKRIVYNLHNLQGRYKSLGGLMSRSGEFDSRIMSQAMDGLCKTSSASIIQCFYCGDSPNGEIVEFVEAHGQKVNRRECPPVVLSSLAPQPPDQPGGGQSGASNLSSSTLQRGSSASQSPAHSSQPGGRQDGVANMSALAPEPSQTMGSQMPPSQPSVRQLASQGPEVSPAIVNNPAPIGVSFDKPKHPRYAVPSTREETYSSDWSCTQTPEAMAVAGFFYTGKEDCTRCFHCSGGLKNWAPGDDPWYAHASWYPRCTYVLQNKGKDFVKQVQAQAQVQVHERQKGLEGSASQGGGLVPEEAQRLQPPGTFQSISAPDSFSSSHPAVLAIQSVYHNTYTEEQFRSVWNKLIQQGLQPANIDSGNLLNILLNANETEEEPVHTGISRSGPSTGAEGAGMASPDQPLPSDSELQSLIKQLNELKEQQNCCICEEKYATVMFLPCSHLVTCRFCAKSRIKCPVVNCDKTIEKRVFTTFA